MEENNNQTVNEFQRRTGITDENVSKQILERNGWDLEKSVVDHNKNKGGLFKTVYNIIRWPFIPVIYVTSGIFSIGKSFLLTMLPFNNDTKRIPEHNLFIQKFEDTYGEIHPAFFAGSFQQAAQKAKNEFQFLVAYIHAGTNPNTEKFCRETLCTELVSDYINTNFVFWAGDVTQRDAFNASNTLGATTYPFIAIIHCSPDNKLQVLDRFVANVPLDEFLERLGNVHELNYGLIQLDRGRASQNIEDHEMISRQDEAYHESLQHDIERLRQEEEKQRKIQEEKEMEEKRKRELENEMIQKNLLQQKEENEKKLKFEQKKQSIEKKKSELSEEPNEGQDVCQIMILLPNGERVKRRFLFTEKLSKVFDFVDTFLLEVDFQDYCLVTAFPRKVFQRSDHSLKHMDFTSKMSLIFEEIYNEDD